MKQCETATIFVFCEIEIMRRKFEYFDPDKLEQKC